MSFWIDSLSLAYNALAPEAPSHQPCGHACVARPAPEGQQRRVQRFGGVNHMSGMPDRCARRPLDQIRIALAPERAAGQRPVKFRRGMVVVKIVPVRPQHQQAQQKIITFEKSARADDLAPAIIGGETRT